MMNLWIAGKGAFEVPEPTVVHHLQVVNSEYDLWLTSATDYHRLPQTTTDWLKSFYIRDRVGMGWKSLSTPLL